MPSNLIAPAGSYNALLEWQVLDLQGHIISFLTRAVGAWLTI